MDSTHEPLRYSPLKLGEIRPLYFEAGGNNKPIRCRMVNTGLGTTPYHALSYVWGIDIDDKPIFVNSHPIDITKNLSQAVKLLRGVTGRDTWKRLTCSERGHTWSFLSQISLLNTPNKKLPLSRSILLATQCCD